MQKTKKIVPISGGKDSTCILIMAIEECGRENVIAVYYDTGWDHPVTHKYLEYLEEELNIKIITIRGHNTKNTKYKGTNLPDLIRNFKMFPKNNIRFCNGYLKRYAFRDWYKENLFNDSTNYEIWFGIRRAESWQRAKKYKNIMPYDIVDINDFAPKTYNKKLRATLKARLPIINLKTEEVFKYLEEKGIKKNPLYDEGTNDRVGCYPCMIAGKKKQAAMFATEFGQKQLEIIRQLEREIGTKYTMYDTGQNIKDKYAKK